MKKFLFLLGCTLILCISQAQPADIDIGYQVTLPEDHNAVVSTVDFPAVSTAPEFVVHITDRSPGVQCEELRAQCSGLRAKSPAINGALSKGDLTNNIFPDRPRDRVNDIITCYRATQPVFSTSNGGSGY